MNRELNIFGDRSAGRAALGRATGYLLKCPPPDSPEVRIWEVTVACITLDYD